MAIQNASDLLVYAKTAAPAKQITRIYVRNSNPVEFADGSTQGRLKINNITNNNGVVTDNLNSGSITNNTSADVLDQIGGPLTFSHNYTQTGSGTIDGYTYREYTNGANGIVPTLEIVSSTATLNEGAIIIEIVTPGSSAIFDPVAFSTSASFSTNMDLRDVTNKDSGGYSESLGGLRSFEVSTDILQSINPDVPLDGTDFFDKLKTRSLVDLSFSDRIRNIIRTNLTQSGVDNFTAVLTGGQANNQPDPFNTIENPSYTASKIIAGAGQTAARLQYIGNAAQLDNKKITWSFYVKGTTGTGAKTECKFQIYTSSWQIEFSPEATNYQDPTDITHWQGNALVSSLSFDAGVEDNLTCSATFTGTGNVYPNGLGPELIGDTGFNDPNYWGTFGDSVVEDGYGKIISTGADSNISKPLNLYATPGDYFLLTYTIHTSSQGALAIHDGWDDSPEFDLDIPSTVGTHRVLLKPGDNSLIIKRAEATTTIWLSSISLKKVL